MPNLLRVTIGWLSLAGSVLALLFMIPLVLQGSRLGFPGELFLFLTVVIYAYGIWSGLQAIRSNPGWQRLSMWFWLSQTPAFTSSVVSFTISCGLGAWLYIRFGPSGFGVGWSAYLGSGFRWSYGKPEPNLVLGANTFAILVAFVLYRAAAAQSAPTRAEA